MVTADLAGVTADDVNLNLQEDVLTLGGKREPKIQQENVNWQRRERAYGVFSRAVQLPFRVVLGSETVKVLTHSTIPVLVYR